MKGCDDAAARLGELLRGIERASALEEAVQERGRRAEARLTTYNAALLFAHRARQPQPALTASFEASLVAPPSTAAPLYLAPPFVGVNAFVNVKLRNHTRIAVGHGWNVRLSVEDPQPNHHSAHQHSVPLPVLDPQHHTTVSFPINLTSHAPLTVSLNLHFVVPQTALNYPTAGRLRSSQNRRLSLTLASHVVLDLVTFSTRIDRPSSDFHLHRSRTSRLTQVLANRAPPYHPLPLSSRIHLPSRRETLNSISGNYRSLLGAHFSIDFTNCQSDGFDATLRAPPTVLPFLRAAIMRRCLLQGVHRVGPTSMEMGEVWERRIVDTADSSLREMGQADRAISQVCNLLNGPVQDCAQGQEQVVFRRAAGAVEAANLRWQEAARGVWRGEET